MTEKVTMKVLEERISKLESIVEGLSKSLLGDPDIIVPDSRAINPLRGLRDAWIDTVLHKFHTADKPRELEPVAEVSGVVD